MGTQLLFDGNLRWSHPTAQQGTDPVLLKRKNKYGLINTSEYIFFPQKARSSALKQCWAGRLRQATKAARGRGRRSVGPEYLQTAIVGSCLGFSLLM